MKSVEHLPLYDKVQKTFHYKFGKFFFFDGYVISEINEGVIYSWEDHAQLVTSDISKYSNDNTNLVYISHRLYSYSVVPNDWIKFFRNQFDLKAYAVVGYTDGGFLNMMIENLFFKKKIRRFTDLNQAINWAETI